MHPIVKTKPPEGWLGGTAHAWQAQGAGFNLHHIHTKGNQQQTCSRVSEPTLCRHPPPPGPLTWSISWRHVPLHRQSPHTDSRRLNLACQGTLSDDHAGMRFSTTQQGSWATSDPAESPIVCLESHSGNIMIPEKQLFLICTLTNLWNHFKKVTSRAGGTVQWQSIGPKFNL